MKTPKIFYTVLPNIMLHSHSVTGNNVEGIGMQINVLSELEIKHRQS